MPRPGPPPAPEEGISLRQLLMSLGEPLVELQAAPAGLDVEVRDVAILDPEDPPQALPGELVLAIGARGRAALPALRAAGAAGAAAVAVKLDAPGQAAPLSEAAAEAGVALLSVRREARWEHLDALARAVIGSGRQETGAGGGEASGDLFSLAQTTAVLTGGIVSVEDTSSRVLAYSRSSDEVDDLRRLSILGWQGPEPYLSKLREWGVFQHLRTSGAVIAIEEHPELGIRRRLAVGIRAGTQPLGTIWVQEGSRPLDPRSEQVLLGAARVAALHLVRRRREVSADLRLTQSLLAGLLDGSTGPQSLATHLGLDARRPALVVGFALHADGAGAEAAGADASPVELTRAELTALISVHAAARHHSALVSPAESRVYVLLPELPAGLSPATVRGWVVEIAEAAGRHLGVRLRAAVGPVAPHLGGAHGSRREADRVLAAMERGTVGAAVAALEEVRAEVVLGEVLDLLAERPAMRDPRLSALTARDARQGTRLAESVLAYLDAFGDVRAAAERLHVHPNTLRYRVRRAEELAGLDLASPQQRLLAMLQLRLDAAPGPGDGA
ncbi:helix-turn-helix domain-containing protein [Streptacidiphilus sp. ASG 303]|uniref:PucR family transcriptional regulator n=1 Tax=Streptacidiphilus sp. ASG 303 TaxID=2896847 RepID=UPI001E4A7412|nr:helix-turn-helix domain-containing protein [Streptacidiphilus sp. ASG 303]MCD0483141.1 helix-turn-helix domain-containing protein [Streptacidiphilus sp. ASG 303]